MEFYDVHYFFFIILLKNKYENKENSKIRLDNYEKHKNIRIPRENHENLEIIWISYENYKKNNDFHNYQMEF